MRHGAQPRLRPVSSFTQFHSSISNTCRSCPTAPGLPTQEELSKSLQEEIAKGNITIQLGSTGADGK